MPENHNEPHPAMDAEASPENLKQDRLKQNKSDHSSPQEKRLALIAAMGQFRPKNATPIQFYNYVREFCIMHNCSIDEAMERSPMSWTKLSPEQQELYNSKMHAALPIPVPRHLVYRAFQMERAGRWKLSSTPSANGGSVMYSVESYAPPTKPTRMQTRIRAQQPRYDNLAETSSCYLETPRHYHVPKKSSTQTTPESRGQRTQQTQQTQKGKGSGSGSPVGINSAASVKGGKRKTGGEAEAEAGAKLISERIKKPVKGKAKSKKLLGDDKGKEREKGKEKEKDKNKKKDVPTKNSKTEVKRKTPTKKHKKKI